MKNVIKKMFLMLVLFGLIAGPAFAADVEMKAFLFDNDTGGDLTTVTKNIGVRLMITNNSSDYFQFNGVNLGRLQLTPMKLPARSGIEANIAWPLIYMNPYGTPSIAVGPGQTLALPGTVLAMAKAELDGVSGLSAGYYFPFLNVQGVDQQDGQYHVYMVTKEPIKILYVAPSKK